MLKETAQAGAPSRWVFISVGIIVALMALAWVVAHLRTYHRVPERSRLVRACSTHRATSAGERYPLRAGDFAALLPAKATR